MSAAAERVRAVLSADPVLSRALPVLRGLDLPDAWIGAGAARNPVWDQRHGLAPAPLSDIDVAYFDPASAAPALDEAIEAALRRRAPDLPWSVRNQARMHLRNSHPPYRSAVHAIGHWVETATAIAVRLDGEGALEIAAPHGLEDLWGLVLRPVPAYRDRREVFQARIEAKGWRARWPLLRLHVD